MRGGDGKKARERESQRKTGHECYEPTPSLGLMKGGEGVYVGISLS